jgi:hypothetical protein
MLFLSPMRRRRTKPTSNSTRNKSELRVALIYHGDKFDFSVGNAELVYAMLWAPMSSNGRGPRPVVRGNKPLG